MLPAILAILTAAGISAGLSWWFARSHRFGALDLPNERSLHQTPVPRTGGLALLAGVLAGVLVIAISDELPLTLAWVGAALLALALISYRDDHGHVPARLRLAVHLGCALLLWFGGLHWDTPGLPVLSTIGLPLPVAAALTLLFIVWMINLYNFMDGMDGFAGGMAVFGFGALAVLGLTGGAFDFAAVCAVIAAAAAGFLSANFPPARLFLGDVGSASLGLLAAAVILWGGRLGLFAPWVGALAFSPFIVDATWTLLRRAANRERLWEAHRSHHYQRLVLAGWGHRRTVLAAYVLMAGVAASAVAAPRLPVAEQWLLLGGWAAIYVLVHLRVALAERSAGPARP